jgi:hypothetical protein
VIVSTSVLISSAVAIFLLGAFAGIIVMCIVAIGAESDKGMTKIKKKAKK